MLIYNPPLSHSLSEEMNSKPFSRKITALAKFIRIMFNLPGTLSFFFYPISQFFFFFHGFLQKKNKNNSVQWQRGNRSWLGLFLRGTYINGFEHPDCSEETVILNR